MATSKKAASKPVARGRAAKVKTATEQSADIGDWDLPATASDFQDSGLAWEDRQLLGTTVRFLYTVVDKRFLRRALRAGYKRQEHDELWRTFDTAAGRERGLDESHAAVDSDPERSRLLAEVDEFENTWFPRTDKIIRRKVPEAQVESFLGSFFANLTQQPLGPAVLNSVSTYLDRVDQLATSRLAGADAVLSTLRSRGLTESKAREIREKIAQLRGGLAATSHTVEADQQAAAKQQKALRELRLAWNDWSTTLRPLYDIREQIQLGLTEARNTAPAHPTATTPAGGTTASTDAPAAR